MKGGEERWPVSVFKYGIDDASGANADERRRPSFEESRTAATSWEGGGGKGRGRKGGVKSATKYRGWWSNVPFDGGRILH